MPSQIKYPLAASQNSANDNAWIDVAEIKTDNSTGAVVSESTIGHGIQGSGTTTVFSHLVTVSDFGFTIPSGATIQGLTVKLRAATSVVQETTSAPSAKYYLNLAQNGTPVGSSTDAALTTGGTYVTYTWGGASNMLGTSVTPADINASTFQVQLYTELNCPYSAEFDNGEWINFLGSSVTIDADYISLEVTYLEPKELDVTVGTFALSGVSPGLQYHRRMSADVGAFSHTGSTADFRRTYRTILFAGSFVLTGQAVAVQRDFTLNPVAQTYNLASIDTNFLRTRIASFDAASFTWSGQTNNLYYNRRFIIDLANLAFTGIPAGLVTNVTLSTDWFQYTGVGYVFEVDSQSFTYTANTANINRGFGVVADTRNIAVSSVETMLRKDTLFTTTVQTYVYTGQTVAFSRGKSFTVASGDFILNSAGVVLRRTSDNGNLLVFFL